MPVISILPHAALCPDGARFEAPQGSILCRALLDHGIRIEHACDMSCACTTCHVIVREGLSSLVPATDDEDDMLDKAWGLTSQSRLSCQIKLAERYPEIDPKVIRFTDLRQKVLGLPGFDDAPERSGERVLEAIQQAWIDEAD
jgi:2Fe-2S ferredoxin